MSVRPNTWLAAGTLALLAACSSEGGSPLGPAPKPRAYGDVNRVTVVADEELRDGPVADSLRYYYQQAYPLMPQPEPLYDVEFLDPEKLSGLQPRTGMRTYVILADLTDADSEATQFVVRDLGEERVQAARDDYARGTSIVADRWAKGQTLIYLFAEGADELARLVAETFPAASARIRQGDASTLQANVYQSQVSTTLDDTLRQLIGLELDVPNDYLVALARDNFVWLRRDVSEATQNLLVTSVPYTGEGQLSADTAVAIRDRLGEMAVRSDTEGSFMVTNDEDLPVLTEDITLDGKYAFVARGIWEMTDDFMGGPFFTYLIPDAASGKLYVIDAFTFAPGAQRGKRNYMQQLEYIVETMNLEESS